MGSVYAALMASAGHEIFAVTDWPDHAAAMAQNGLRVDGASGDRTVRVHASTTTQGLGRMDLIVIATKARDVEAASRSALPLIGPDTLVQTLQNGLGSAEKVAAVVGADRTVVGVAGGFGASLEAPGHARHNGMETVQFGAFAAAPRAALEASAEIWRGSGFKVEVTDETERMVWRKLLVNVTVSAACCLTGLTVKEVMDSPTAWPIARACLLEAVAVAAAKGIDLQVGDPVAHVSALASKIPAARPSMLLDHMARRPSEIDQINGAVETEGLKLHMPTPVNATLAALVRAREACFAAG